MKDGRVVDLGARLRDDTPDLKSLIGRGLEQVPALPLTSPKPLFF